MKLLIFHEIKERPDARAQAQAQAQAEAEAQAQAQEGNILKF